MIYCTFAVISTVLILVTISIILPLSSNTSGKIGNHVSNRKAIIEKVKEETVTTVLVNENWFSDYKTEINGENISSKNIDNRDKVAIIGSSLALKLFFTTDAVGKKICIDGNQYTICGVICENESLINKFSADDKQRVYVPYTTSENYGDRTVDMIVYDNSVYTGAIVEQMDLPQYYSVNLNEKNQTLSSFEHILYLAIFIGFSIIALKLWYRFSRKFFEKIKENLKLNYFLKSLKNIPLKYVALVLVFAGIPAVLLIAFNICDFSIFIPSKYIPNDNIFDISNYLNVLVDNAQTLNSQSLTGNLALPTLIAISSAALSKPPISSLAVLGEISIGGTLIKVEDLASTLQVCLDSGAKKVLLPITSAADLGTVPSDLVGAFSLIFYSSPEEAVYKALGVE